MKYDWDPAKQFTNVHKHSISFIAAVAVFDDPGLLEIDVSRPEHRESRIKAVGQLAPGWVVAVIYTVRDDTRRIISARRARRHERSAYDAGHGLT